MPDATADTQPNAADPAGAQVDAGAPKVADTAETAAPVAPYWPEDWRDRFVPETGDQKLRQHLNRFTSPEGLFKQWRNYERQRNNGSLKPARPDTDDADALAAWRKEVGAPDAPDGYYQHIEIDQSAIDKPALDRMFARMHDLGVPVDQAKEVVGEYFSMMQEQAEAVSQRDAEFKRAAEDDLRAEWGPEYRQNLNAIGVLFEQHGSPELFEALEGARFGDGRRLADDPGVLKFLAAVARELHPDSNIIMTPTSGLSRSQSIESEIEALELEMRDTKARQPGSYWANPGKQKRYAELLAAQERMNGRR